MTEADSLADIHLGIKEKLVGEIQSDVKMWKGDHYHKGKLAVSIKETKELEESFKKVSLN